MRNYFLFVFLVFFFSCSVGDNISVGTPKEISIDGVEGNKIKLTISIPITNTNTFRIKIKDINLDARVDGKYLGVVTSNSKIIVPPNTKAYYDIELDLEIKNIILGATTIFQISKNEKHPKLDLEGEVKASGLIITKTITIKQENILNNTNL